MRLPFYLCPAVASCSGGGTETSGSTSTPVDPSPTPTPICDVEVDHCLDPSPVRGNRLCTGTIHAPVNGRFIERVLDGNQVQWLFESDDGEIDILYGTGAWLPDLVALGDVRVDAGGGGCEYGGAVLVMDSSGSELLLASGSGGDTD
jgi:hypothetical protein